MVLVTKMQMRGFKSFAHKTEVVFGEHFNCVLGPNGSGKSNVIDALCFVLGKASVKGLRAEKSANLIYNGGKSKKPAKQGEVSIYFSNPKDAFGIGGDEVKVTRVIKQSGQGVYKINDKTMTRQQVLELLSRARINPDGYNIILQGDIINLVEMSTNERRKIVEEIAGISVYEEKKEKALRELARVEERLNEADIILAERHTYLKELKTERDQAQKFKDLDDKIKQNKATALHLQVQEKRKLSDKQQALIDDAKQQVEKHRAAIDKLRKHIDEKKEEIERINKEVEEKGEKEQVALHKEVEALRVDTALNKQRIQILGAELEKLSQRRAELDKGFAELNSKTKRLQRTKKDLEQQISKKEKEVAQLDKRLEQFKRKNNMEDAAGLNKRTDEIDKEADAFAEKLNKLREEQQQLLREKDKHELTLQGIDEKIEKVLGLKKEHKGQLDELKKKKESFKQATVELSKCLNEDTSLATQLANARTKLLSRQEEHSKLQGQQSRVRESLGRGDAINAIMDLKKKGVHGLVSELAQVDKQYAVAVSTAAGGRIKSIVTEDDRVAEECIDHLKKRKLGVATFLPMNKLRPPVIDAAARQTKSKGVHGLAVDLLSYDKKYEKVFQYVFGSTLVVDDLSVARRIGVGKLRMVTLSGDVTELSGAMQGGHRQRDKGGFQEKELSAQLGRLESEIVDLEGMIATLAQRKQDNEEAIQRLREHKATLEGEVIKLEKSLHLDSADVGVNKEEKKKLQAELKELDKRYDDVVGDIAAENKGLASLKAEKQKLRDQINALQSPALLAELNSFEQKKEELKDHINQLRLELKANEAEVANILGPEGENIQRILKQHEKEAADFTEEKQGLEKKVKGQEKELVEREAAEKEFYDQFKELFNKRSALTDEANKAENDIMAKNEQVRSQEARMNTASLEQAKYKAELAGLEEEFKQYEGVPLFEDKPLTKIQQEIAQFEKMVEDIGAVNMKALEIYERVESEYHKLQEKKGSLGEERENVLLMINEVDAKKKELFMRTYNVVNDNFKRLFGMLSTKGEATLELDDPKEVFDGGLSLMVRITGKKFMDVRSLSGGEKTLTALAFIFAVQEHEPAPFYILDEVDAALDKKNSERLAKLLQNYAKKAQYIIISHNDGVITEADNLYGISMNEHGMSKLT
ncbi:chromosome segregation protein SMC, partial [Candidatus Woesearchaeota archaeon]|nr:chromosome segregation protein SMC [Candidatus Woesearchaeota archaeon]